MRTFRGFTLVEILIVIVIAASVLMFALPANKKAQERNKYLAAVGVLSDLGMALQALRADAAMAGTDVVYPAVGSTEAVLSAWQTTSNSNYSTAEHADLSSLTSTNFPFALFAQGYLQPIPADGNDATLLYKGYSFTLCSVKKSDNTDNNVVAIMQTGNSSAYQGARYYRDGTVEQISGSNPSCF